MSVHAETWRCWTLCKTPWSWSRNLEVLNTLQDPMSVHAETQKCWTLCKILCQCMQKPRGAEHFAIPYVCTCRNPEVLNALQYPMFVHAENQRYWTLWKTPWSCMQTHIRHLLYCNQSSMTRLSLIIYTLTKLSWNSYMQYCPHAVMGGIWYHSEMQMKAIRSYMGTASSMILVH